MLGLFINSLYLWNSLNNCKEYCTCNTDLKSDTSTLFYIAQIQSFIDSDQIYLLGVTFKTFELWL